MRAYSQDLRRRIVDAVAAGESQSAVARRFAVERSTVRRYLKRWRETGSLAPAPIPGDTPAIRTAQYPLLVAQLDADPDATLAMHCARWEADRGVAVSRATMQRTIARIGWTVKKNGDCQ
jgi:transposase